ncbi:AbgT family transporter [Streptomyces lydicus]|uniref:AbgT family transporter n=1 Tax=Streptomyces lydicus TaxID=47763 RepID=UPI001F50CED4|nr:AbgT family transporter [Streptomyces lydicus]
MGADPGETDPQMCRRQAVPGGQRPVRRVEHHRRVHPVEDARPRRPDLARAAQLLPGVGTGRDGGGGGGSGQRVSWVRGAGSDGLRAVSQFVALFKWTNIGTHAAVRGADALRDLGAPTLVLFLVLIAAVAGLPDP